MVTQLLLRLGRSSENGRTDRLISKICRHQNYASRMCESPESQHLESYNLVVSHVLLLQMGSRGGAIPQWLRIVFNEALCSLHLHPPSAVTAARNQAKIRISRVHMSCEFLFSSIMTQSTYTPSPFQSIMIYNDFLGRAKRLVDWSDLSYLFEFFILGNWVARDFNNDCDNMI